MKKNIQKVTTRPQENKAAFLFTRENYIIMIVGMVFIVVGFLLMIGGGSKDKAVFNEAIFDTRRITVSPILLLIGYALQIVAIFYRKAVKKTEE
jgi:hypothetical protein